MISNLKMLRSSLTENRILSGADMSHGQMAFNNESTLNVIFCGFLMFLKAI